MNNLPVKIDELHGLTKTEQAIVKARQSPRVGDIPEKDLKNIITTIITMALFDLGHKMDLKDRQVLESRLKDGILKRFHKNTGEEIRQAIELGVRGEYKSKPEDVVFITVSNIEGWIKAFNSKTKVEVIKKFNILEEKREKEAEVEDKERRIKEAEQIRVQDLISAYNDVNTGRSPYDPAGILFDHLDKRGLIKLSEQRIDNLVDESIKEYKQSIVQANSVSEYLQAKKIKAEMERGSKRIEAIVGLIYKKKALKEVIKDIIESGLTMEEYLETEETK
jgi:hypothetical protein